MLSHCSIGNNTGKLQASVKREADSTFLRVCPGCQNTTGGDKGIGLLTSSGTSNEKLSVTDGSLLTLQLIISAGKANINNVARWFKWIGQNLYWVPNLLQSWIYTKLTEELAGKGAFFKRVNKQYYYFILAFNNMGQYVDKSFPLHEQQFEKMRSVALRASDEAPDSIYCCLTVAELATGRNWQD